ncbi:replication associated protein A [Urochloa decumbens associated virus]
MSNTEQAGPSQFKFKGQNAFLTYPRCNLDPETVGLMLWSLLTPYGVSYVHVSREHHKDGTPHLHALTQARRRVHTTNHRFFDLEGFHPNVQAVRNPKAVLSYVSKHPSGEFVQGVFRARGARSSTSRAAGKSEHHDGSSGSTGSGHRPRHSIAKQHPGVHRDSAMNHILDNANSRASFLQGVRKAFPYEYCVRMNAWEYAASKLYPEHIEPYTSPFPNEMFHCHETLSDWVAENVYHVTPQVYSLLHPHSDAEGDLRWLHDTCFAASRRDHEASTSAAPQGQVNHHGQEAWDDTTTGRTT